MARHGRGYSQINHNHLASYTECWDRQAAREPSLATLDRLDRLGLADARGVGLTPVTVAILGLVGAVASLESIPGPEQIGINNGLD